MIPARPFVQLLVLAGLVLAVLLLLTSDVDRHFTAETMQMVQRSLAMSFQDKPLLVAGAFVLACVGALVFFLPGAIATAGIAGGAIFGPLWGLVIVLAAVTIGDSLSFLSARYLMRSWVERSFRPALARINHGIERDGAIYLLTLRLMAVVPFFIVNLTMGLTRMPLKIFAPVSLVGLLPITAVYVLAGAELGRLADAGNLWSPRLILVFAVLGTLPLAARFAYRLLRRRSNQPEAL